MTPKKILLIVITTFLIAMSMGNAFGASIVTQHEGGVQNDQGTTVEKANNNVTTLEPRQIKIKADSAPEDKAGKNEEEMEKYKMPAEGEGEKK